MCIAPFYEIWNNESTGGKAVHAAINLPHHHILCDFKAKETSNMPCYLSLQINEDQHIMLDPEWLQYINHSCAPNVYFDTNAIHLVTLRPIKAGEELTFFYPSTEWSMAQGFKCLCGHENCLQEIKGAKFLSNEILSNYRLSEHIKCKLLQCEQERSLL